MSETIQDVKSGLYASIKALDDSHKDYTVASYQYECLKKLILEYQSKLDDDHEIAVTLTSFGNQVTMLVEQIRYYDPVLIVFYGMFGDNTSTLVQHVSQLNILLTTVSKQNPDEPPRRIGFDTSG